VVVDRERVREMLRERPAAGRRAVRPDARDVGGDDRLAAVGVVRAARCLVSDLFEEETTAIDGESE
jgi:hypothetical protein